MALTGSNLAFGKAIAAAVPVYLFVLFRFAVASAALAPVARGGPGRGARRRMRMKALAAQLGSRASLPSSFGLPRALGRQLIPADPFELR